MPFRAASISASNVEASGRPDDREAPPAVFASRSSKPLGSSSGFCLGRGERISCAMDLSGERGAVAQGTSAAVTPLGTRATVGASASCTDA